MRFTSVCTAWPRQSIIVLLPTGDGCSDVVTRTLRHLHAFTHHITCIDTAYALHTERRGASHVNRARFIPNDGTIVLPSSYRQGRFRER
jgi:hypothetical protein